MSKDKWECRVWAWSMEYGEGGSGQLKLMHAVQAASPERRWCNTNVEPA